MRRTGLAVGVGIWIGLIFGAEARAQKPPLLPEKDVAALANEISGETAKRNLEGIARFHRQRGSKGFHEAAELVAERLRAYGLSDVAILQFPADGKIFYGTQRSRPAWDAEMGELSELVSEEGTLYQANGLPPMKAYGVANKVFASFYAEPIVLAEDSESANVMAYLVDVGEGTKESDYTGKDVKGKIVLVSAQPGAVQDLAVGKFGAAGIVSYAQNQKTAWSGENRDAIRWGHLDTFSSNKTFAFMVSLKTAREFKERLAKGKNIWLQAVVKGGQHAGNYEVVTATIPGADAKLKEEEIAFSCHLDHQRPGANDNASGCSAILEVARTLQRLIDEKKLERPARTIRFIFPPEIEGTMALLNGKPEFAKRIKAVVHMDMVGGGPETKAVFHVTRGPMSLPSFVHDVAWAFADWVNEESYQFAATGKAEYPMVAPEGGKEPLRAEYSAFTMGSDHDVYQDSSFGIPAIYLNDWPDRYIHTNFDSAANIDPTKLKRAAFIGAASGYSLAGMGEEGAGEAANLHGWMIRQETLWRKMRVLGLAGDNSDANNMAFKESDLNLAMRCSIVNLGTNLSRAQREVMCARPPGAPAARMPLASSVGGEGLNVFRRKGEPRGPLAVFGYDYFSEHAKAAGIETPKLLSYEGLWGAGEEYAYEVLNFADGKRNAQEIRDAVSAEYGPVPLELVVEYLKALEKINVVVMVR
ncbi:MAG TPA: M28 family peptidase [Candidatus Dormibacteraeota bacterium]|jgi:aminopeptidase YwaD|nr:M28 family peptidase [Candidatus Dormibacteraeota bacterium]